MRIGSHMHHLQIIKTNKVSLRLFDDKRFILEDGISTLPHGHYTIRDIQVTRDIIDEPDWGNEEDEEVPTSPTWDEMIGNDRVITVSQMFPEEQQNAQVAREPQEYFTENDDEPFTLTQQMMEAWSPLILGSTKGNIVSLKVRRRLTIWMNLAKRHAHHASHSSMMKRKRQMQRKNLHKVTKSPTPMVAR